MGTREEQSPGMNLGQQTDVRLGDVMGTREAGLWHGDRDSWYQDKIRGTTGPELILAAETGPGRSLESRSHTEWARGQAINIARSGGVRKRKGRCIEDRADSNQIKRDLCGI